MIISLSYQSTGKHPRRLSSTPKKRDGPLVAFSAPEVDSSLEEAILYQPSHPRTQPPTHHLPSPRLSRVTVDTSRSLRDSSLSQSVLRSSTHKSKSKTPVKRGLSVSFVDGNKSRTPKKTSKRLSEKEKGESLVDSLNASKHGALDLTLSQRKRKFPRMYADDDPKLGYDWIAGLIDASDTYLSERDDEYFRDMKEFRRVNCSECYKPREGM